MAEGLVRMQKIITLDAQLHVAPYWEDAKVELMKRDRIMRKLIPQFGDLHLTRRGEPFTTLARSVIGQQISIKAAETVWQKFLLICPKCSRSEVLKAGTEQLPE